MGQDEIRDLYSELNLAKLKELAAQWADWHPVIVKILLFKSNALIDEEGKYVLVAVIPALKEYLKIQGEYKEKKDGVRSVKNLPRKRVLKEIENLKSERKEKLKSLSAEEQMAIRAANWSSPDCLHIQEPLKKAYEGTKAHEIIGEWMWLNVSNLKIEETDIIDTVNLKSRIVLYEKVPEVGGKLPFEHSGDFSDIWCTDGKHFLLSKAQAKSIKILSEEWKKGTPVLHQTTIVHQVTPDTSTKRLRDIFKGNLDAYKKLIEPVKELKGGVRLRS